MNFKKALLVFITFFISTHIAAQNQLAVNVLQRTNAPNDIRMTITPSICVVKTRGEVCQMTANVMWQAHLAIDACLYKNDDLVACWEQKNKIKEKLNLSLIQDLVFTLKNKNEIVAKQRIKVSASTSTKYRRRLRSQWSLF